MKKTLLSILFGITLVGSAFAVPSLTDRRALCERNTDKYVWVEKTQACVPINPCEYDDVTIKDAYCIPVGDMLNNRLPSDEQMRTLVINRYVEKVLKSKVSEIKTLSEDSNRLFVAVNTFDGNYFVFAGSSAPAVLYESCEFNMKLAGWAYGLEAYDSNWSVDDNGLYSYYKEVTNDRQCEDIADFATVIGGKLIKWYIGDDSEKRGYGVCNMFCASQW